MTNSRVNRGRRTQKAIARFFRACGWPYAEAVEGFTAGRDITGMPGLAPEAKATSEMPKGRAIAQALRNAGRDLGFVIWRANGVGEDDFDNYVVLLRLPLFAVVLREAGYGDPIPPAHEFVCPSCGATTRARMEYYP